MRELDAKTRLACLDGIRGVLAVFVALSHAYSHFTGWGSGYNFFRNATFAVDIFFILSGIVLYHNYQLKIKNGMVKEFLLSRFLRLYPLHIIAMMLIPLSLFISTGNAFPGWTLQPTFLRFFSDLLLLNNFSGLVAFLNPPTWSISSELFVGSIVVIACCFRFYLAILIIVSSLLIMLLTSFKSNDIVTPIMSIISGGMLRCAFCISLGVIAYKIALYIQEDSLLFRAIDRTSIYALFTVIALMVGLRLTVPQYVVITAALSVYIAVMSMNKSSVSWLLNSEPLKELGFRSYSIYLLHTPVIYLFIGFKSENLSHNVFFATLSIILTIYISKFTSRYIEKPFIDIGKR